MNDTAPEINEMIFRGMMRKTPGERLLMGLDMRTTSRELVWASIPADLPATERRRAFYRCFYGEQCPF